MEKYSPPLPDTLFFFTFPIFIEFIKSTSPKTIFFNVHLQMRISSFDIYYNLYTYANYDRNNFLQVCIKMVNWALKIKQLKTAYITYTAPYWSISLSSYAHNKKSLFLYYLRYCNGNYLKLNLKIVQNTSHKIEIHIHSGIFQNPFFRLKCIRIPGYL